MPTAYADLARACERLARRRPAWAAVPVLRPVAEHAKADGGVADVDAIVRSVRNYDEDVDRSDQTVRALVAISEQEPDALTVLLHALAPMLRRELSRSATEEYRTDALVDLVFVIGDAVQRGELADHSRLAHRLVKRACRRARRRTQRTCAVPWSPEWIGDAAGIGPEGMGLDVADLATARADLANFTRAVDQAVRQGELSPSGWTTYRDHRLAGPLAVRSTASTASQRAIAARTARRLEPLVDVHLACHAA